MEFLVDPGEQGDGTVGEAVAERLGFGALDFVVAAAFLPEPVCPRQGCLFILGVGRYGMLQCQQWRAGECRCLRGSDVVDVTGCSLVSACSQKYGYCFSWERQTFAMLRVQKTNDSSNVTAPITSLSYLRTIQFSSRSQRKQASPY